MTILAGLTWDISKDCERNHLLNSTAKLLKVSYNTGGFLIDEFRRIVSGGRSIRVSRTCK